MVPFAGFEMPVQYAGVREEHLAVREGAGVFDVSHMGEIETSGPGAEGLLQRLLTNDVAALQTGGAQYSCMCAQDGGVLDDVITYRLDPDRFVTVTNAANAGADAKRFAEFAGGHDADVSDAGERYAMVAVQGPRAREIVAGLAEGELPGRMRIASLRVAGAQALVCGTGYTGEDGVELLLDPVAAPDVWDALMDAGVAPCGLAARDTLRLEACLPLYGNELTAERTPIAAGLGWCCREERGPGRPDPGRPNFVGAEAIAAERASGPAERLVAFALTGRGVPRAGNAVMVDAGQVGTVTSGTHSPSLGEGIGMAYVRADLAEPGTELEIDVRGTRRAARVERRPLYQRDTGQVERSHA